MPLHALTHRLWFPPVTDAMGDGLLAMGGDVDTDRLILAYRSGIFPWYDGEIPLWWCPDPRFVLLPDDLKISKSMRALEKKGQFHFTTNTVFEEVIGACKSLQRRGQDGTWITDEMEAAFIELHHKGIAWSAEAWEDGILVGGLYGIRMGRIVFGESMFTHKSNASKYAFIQYIKQLKKEGVVLIDCQVYTEHLESLGAAMIPRKIFIELLGKHI